MTATIENAEVETLETFLENARVAGTPVRLVLGGDVDHPRPAVVRARNGQTFELVVGTAVLRMELGGIVVRTD